MATSKEYLELILEGLSELEEITFRMMMGEYIIYYRRRTAAYVCDNRLLVKPVPSAVRLLPNARYESPYEGAKEMIVVEDIENREFLKMLFEAMYPELPEPKQGKTIKVKKLSSKDIPKALDLVWEVFSEFEAPEYSQQGIDEFISTLGNSEFTEKLKFYGAFEGTELVGVLAMCEPQHISLFFVKADRHKKGIGRKLFNRMKKDYETKEFTVNSSPYAAEAYRHLGFSDTDGEQLTNGIRYIPMKFTGI